MALVANFSASQTYGEESIVTLTDTSTGTDVAVTKRRVYLIQDDGSYLVPDGTTTDYVEWDDFPATTTINIDALDQDYALNIRVDWLDVNDTVLYTKTRLYCFTLYGETQLYSLTQGQSANPLLSSDTFFYTNKMKLRVDIDDANQAVQQGGDITAAQQALNRAMEYVNNASKYF